MIPFYGRKVKIGDKQMGMFFERTDLFVGSDYLKMTHLEFFSFYIMLSFVTLYWIQCFKYTWKVMFEIYIFWRLGGTQIVIML